MLMDIGKQDGYITSYLSQKQHCHVLNWCAESQTCKPAHALLIDDLIWHYQIMYALGNLLNYFIA